MVDGAGSGAVGRVRTTRQAGLIEAELRGADGFRSAHQLFTQLRGHGETIGLSTVYRYLNLLVGQGRADVISTVDGEARFRLCGSSRDGVVDVGHHHHLVCRVCGRSVEVTGPAVEAWAVQVAERAGYTDITHTVEVFGRCPEHRSIR